MALGKQACQCQGDLLGRPAQAQKVDHHAPQDGVWMEFDLMPAKPSALPALALRNAAGVARGTTVAPQLSADGGRSASQLRSDLSYAEVLLPQAGDGDAVFRLKVLITRGGCLNVLTLPVVGVALQF